MSYMRRNLLRIFIAKTKMQHLSLSDNVTQTVLGYIYPPVANFP